MMQPSIPLGETFQKTQPLIPHDSISLSCCFCHSLLGLKSISTHHKNLPKYKANSHAPRISWRAERSRMTFCTADSPQIHAPSVPLPETEPTRSPFLSLSTELSLSLPGWLWPFPVLYIKILPAWVYKSAEERPAKGCFVKQKPSH